MQVSVETTSGLERRLTITVPAADVDAKVNQKLAEVAKTAKINGFRKGKVPLKVINQQYGESARQEVASDLINTSYMEAVQQEAVRPAEHSLRALPRGELEGDPDRGAEGERVGGGRDGGGAAQRRLRCLHR